MIENLFELELRDSNFRQILKHKIYDTTREDEIAKYIINNTKFKNMLLIRYNYKSSETTTGNMVFYDTLSDILYTVEIGNDVDKCITNSKLIKSWASKEGVPVLVTENAHGKIDIIESNPYITRTTYKNSIEKNWYGKCQSNKNTNACKSTYIN